MIASAIRRVIGCRRPAEEPVTGSRKRLIKTRTKSADKGTKPGRIHAVLTTLGSEIAQDVFAVGDALPPEHDLEIRFGVGRGVVREAIKTLAAKGLVSVRPRHGTHVRPRRDWSLLDRDVLTWLAGSREPDRELLLAIQEVRLIIEPAAAALAAERATRSTGSASMPRWWRWRPRTIRPAPPPPTRRSTSPSSMRRIIRCCRVFAARSIPS